MVRRTRSRLHVPPLAAGAVRPWRRVLELVAPGGGSIATRLDLPAVVACAPPADARAWAESAATARGDRLLVAPLEVARAPLRT